VITNSLNPLSGPANIGTPAALRDQLVKRADLNHDGQVSNAEFSQFLAALLPDAAPAGTSPKDLVAQLLSSHPATPAGLQNALGSIQRLLPGTTISGGDTLDIPGFGRVNVAKFNGADAGWRWHPLDGAVRR
jgi:hypothetical protein